MHDEADRGTAVIAASRLDRQLRIEGWDQAALDRARVAVVGDDDTLASLFVLSASALGINSLVVVAPVLDAVLTDIAVKVNPLLRLTHLEGFYTHPALDDVFHGCTVMVDVSHYGLANKLLLERAFRESLPLVRGLCFERGAVQGLRVLTYIRGREWGALDEVVCPQNLPGPHFDDGVLAAMVSGIVLEEVKSLLMRQRISDAVIAYERPRTGPGGPGGRALVVGAGALGTFVGLGLAYWGMRECTFMDPDVVESTNLNRQVLFYDAIGRSKAETLSQRLNERFGMKSSARVAYFGKDFDLSDFDVVFDCVDNFETRIVLSQSCRDQEKPLISGGTSATAGQVVVYDPRNGGATPAELLGMADIVKARAVSIPVRERAACSYRPDPSVVMTNQITAGFMVDACRRLFDGQEAPNVFYDSTGSRRI